METFNVYRSKFESLCKNILIYGADVKKMKENKAKLLFLANDVIWYYGFVKDNDVDDKDSLLNDINNLLGDIRYMISGIDRFIDEERFTDYLNIVKMCVNIIE